MGVEDIVIWNSNFFDSVIFTPQLNFLPPKHMKFEKKSVKSIHPSLHIRSLGRAEDF